jgi:PKD repeat protein
MNGNTTYLIDIDGNIVNSWSCSSQCAYSVYLLEDGGIMRTAVNSGNQLNGAAIAGKVEKYDWDGNLVWEYVYSGSDYCTHHDIEPLPNGNVLLISWDVRSATEVTQAGGSSSSERYSEKIVEIEPSGSTGGTVVWEWYFWDHLVQDYNSSQDNYGVVADHPELLNVNYSANSDWIHMNGIDYNEDLDQIIVSSHNLNEVYVIDHSTTTAEAASHTGGNSGMGGDILYRWGNPEAYDRGDASDAVLNVTHAAMFVDAACDYTDMLMTFNNQGGSGGGSSVVVFDPPRTGYTYDIDDTNPYTPSEPTYEHNCLYSADGQSGAHFLDNGNLFVSLNNGYLYEVTPDGDLVWSFNSGQVAKAFRYGECYPGVSEISTCDPPVCDFEADQTTVTAGTYINFTDLSTNYPTEWAWTFTGGTPSSSTEQNPTIQYTTVGTYEVSLTSTNGAGSDSETKTAYITVNAVTDPPVVDFEASSTSITMGETIDFTDLSSNLPTSWSWTFTGGVPASSTDQNPTGIQYDTPGTYTVSLTATNSFGSGTEEKIDYIIVLEPEYCDASGTDEDEYISNVVFEDVSNSSNFDGYGDYTAISTDVTAGETYTISVTNEISYSLDQLLVWIDFDQSYTFDNDELVFTGDEPGSSSQSQYVYSGDVAIPSDAEIGETRMRIRLHYNSTQYGGNSDPCGESTYGEVEDYTVNILSAEVAPVADFSANVTEICVGETVTFTDASLNEPTSWSWTFTGGTPSSSTEQNPTVTWNTAGNYSVTLTATNAYGSNSMTNDSYITVNELPVVTFTTTGVNCYGESTGSISTSVSDGTSPYTYSWSNSSSSATASSLSAGTYTVTVTDNNGCTAAGSSSVTEPASAVSVTASTTSDVSCYGGSTGAATSSASGGTSGYTYTWTGSLSGADQYDLSAGSYTVTVEDALGCIATDVVTIAQPDAALAVTASVTENVSCYGESTGSVSASASGGTATYTYTWTGDLTGATQTNLSAGTYTVVVEDANGCTISSTTSVTQPSSALNAEITEEDVTCYGGTTGSASVTASGGTPSYSYLWNNSITTSLVSGLSIGTYTCTITDINGCETEISTTIEQPEELSASISSSTDALCNGNCDGTATASGSGGTSPYTYTWDAYTGSQTTQTASGLCTGTYEVIILDAVSCTASASVNINEPDEIIITPSITDASCGSDNGQASVSVNGGTSPYSYDWSPDGLTGDGTDTYSNLTSGSYTIDVVDNDGCSANALINISEVGGPTLTTSFSEPSCFGDSDGEATVTAEGGTAPYTYLWGTNTGDQTTETAASLPAGTYNVTVTDATPCASSTSVIITEPEQITTTVSYTDVTCNAACDGTATVYITNGVEPYVIAWSDLQTTETAVNICPGEYCVTVYDANNCHASSTPCVTISEPVELTLNTVSITNVVCFDGNDGAALVEATGGIPSYTYTWSDGNNSASNTGLASGTYNVSVTDQNNCTATNEIIVNQPTIFNIDNTVVNASCGQYDGSIQIIVSGSTPPYTYQWSSGQTTNNLSDLQAGAYILTVTDVNLCTIETVINVNDESGPEITSIDITNISCYGYNDGMATVNVSGGTSPYSYLWSNGGSEQSVSDLEPGDISIQVTDNNSCIATFTAIVNEPEILELSYSSTPETPVGSENGTASVSVSGGTSPYYYEWNPGGETTSEITGLSFGNYYVTVIDENGCTESTSVYVDFYEAISDMDNMNSYTIYPNPTNGIINIDFNSIETETIIITDMLGKQLQEVKITNSKSQIDMTDYKQGIYFINFFANGQNHISKVIISR